ncbi:hypothetical protein SAMN05892883_2850 [Jatrophihabitans sp. GAS493]|uniref:hypothetical protein n=1 Tax=Jatrophihabitans sp. GAS493 TaxID=1907575 RepID=UPI000BB6A082|nr:hypothetical protein [Jatrophihabitans sp. GAS493]SOD73556.1 hypothetical protein SAMN05892883_2850 [Jatrophihabitans sp. GAS493]
MSRTTFVDDLLAGRALIPDLDDYVETWHELPNEDPSSKLELHEFLGMSWDEYSSVIRFPASIRFLVAARRNGETLDQTVSEVGLHGIAARADSQNDAEQLLRWLKSRGLLGDSAEG